MTKRVRERRIRTARLMAWLDAGRKPSKRTDSARRFLALAFGA